jgi:hypothetical protein
MRPEKGGDMADTAEGILKSTGRSQTSRGTMKLSAQVDKWYYGVFDESEFDKFDSLLNKRVRIEYTTTQDGKYRNYVPGTLEEVERVNRPRSSDSSIETQVAYKGVIELLCNKVLDLSHPLSIAALKWATNRLGTGKSPLVEAAIEMGAEPEREEEADVLPIKDANDFMQRCAAIGLTSREVTEITKKSGTAIAKMSTDELADLFALILIERG